MASLKTINVIIVHGIGTPQPGYAQPLIAGLTEKFSFHLQKTLPMRVEPKDNLIIREVIWDDVLAANQEKLAVLLKKGFIQHKNKGLREILSKVFAFATNWILRLRTDFAAEAISDVIGYKNNEAYPQIQQRLLDAINSLRGEEREAGEKQHLTIISHSLGTVISSDFVYDRLKAGGTFHDQFLFSNFFTLGSPLALFALQYGIELFKSPVHLEEAAGQWMNIFDLDDPIAYPLKNLNEAYDKAVTVDREVNTGGFGVSHTRYFQNPVVQDVIAEKLARDWLRINGKLTP